MENSAIVPLAKGLDCVILVQEYCLCHLNGLFLWGNSGLLLQWYGHVHLGLKRILCYISWQWRTNKNVALDFETSVLSPHYPVTVEHGVSKNCLNYFK